MKISYVAIAALMALATSIAANAQQQPAATPTPQKGAASASDDCVRMPNKKHEHGADRGTGRMAMQPCAPAQAAPKPASGPRKTHDARKNS